MRRWVTDWLEEPRNRWISIGALALLLLFVLPWLVGPRVVLTRARERAKAYGLELEAEDASVGFGGVSLTGLSVKWPGEGEPLVRIADLAFELRWGRISEGARAIAGVRIERGTVRLSVRDLQRLAQSRREPTGAAAGHTAVEVDTPRLDVQNLDISLRDEHGVLLQIVSGSVHSDSTGLTARANQLQVGDAPGDVVRLERTQVDGEFEKGRPLLTGMRSEAGELDWAEATASTDGQVEGSRTLQRLWALRDSVRASASGSASAPHDAPKVPLPMKRGAKLDFKQLRVNEAPQTGPKVVLLDGLAVGVESLGDGSVRTQGKGSAPGSGQIGWDLKLTPGEARVEGKLLLRDVSLGLLGPVLPPLPFHELASTRLHADLELTARGYESVAAKGAFSVRDLAFYSEGLARMPVGPFGLEVKGEATWTPAKHELSNLKAELETGAVTLSVAGGVAWLRDAYRVDLVADMPKHRCADVLLAVPSGLLDELSAIELGGSVAGKLTVHVDSADLDSTKVDFDVADACSFGALPTLLDLGRFHRPFAHQALEPDGTVFEMETGPGTPNWTPIEFISPFFVQAVVSHEDGRFFGHHGFAEPEIGVALARNLKAKAFKFGASTITMQLVKNVFLHRDKLLARKVQEALVVWWLEQQWDKRRILELYLNVIEYGPAIYGIRNASMHYFGVLPMDLTPAQAGFLACILPSPKSSHVHYEKGALSASAKNRIANLLKHMHTRERIDADALAYGLEELERFRFYDPRQPPPVPPLIRGTAQKPPFNTAGTLLDPWDALLPGEAASETGGFGNP